MSLKIRGLMSLIRIFRTVRDIHEKAVHDALMELAFEVLKEAKKRTPVDTGFLRDSGTVEVEGDKIKVVFKAKYALPVHERTEVSHAVGEAKFLENAFHFVVIKKKVTDSIWSRILDAI